MEAPTQVQPVFSLIERRVLGVMVEKAKTTPDAYPLSLNSLTTGCNQKSNRDPVLNLSDDDVESCLGNLQKTGLVTRSREVGSNAGSTTSTSSGTSTRSSWPSSRSCCCAARRPKANCVAGPAAWSRSPTSTSCGKHQANGRAPPGCLPRSRRPARNLDRPWLLSTQGTGSPESAPQGEAAAVKTAAASAPVERVSAGDDLRTQVGNADDRFATVRDDFKNLAEQVQQLRSSLGA